MPATGLQGPQHARDDVTIVGISGSLRENSFTTTAVQIALLGASSIGAHTRAINLGDYDLPFCDGSKTEYLRFPDVRRLKDELRAADGIVLGSPEYHGSYSGVLKNALDLMGFDEFEGKLVGLVSVSGGALGGTNALNELRSVGRALHAWVVPEQASVPMAYTNLAFSVEDAVGAYADRLRSVGAQVARFASLHRAAASLEFVKLWEEAPANPGGVQ